MQPTGVVITGRARCVLDALKAVTMNALLLQRPDYALGHRRLALHDLDDQR